MPRLSAGQAVGGSQIFKNQSLCPFRAFAEQRLGAKAMRQPEPGLDSLKRGILLHHVLELFWSENTDQAQLLAMSEDELINSLSGHIQTALDAQARKSPHSLSKRFRVLESQRLLSVLLKWMQVEKQRSPFTVNVQMQ